MYAYVLQHTVSFAAIDVLLQLFSTRSLRPSSSLKEPHVIQAMTFIRFLKKFGFTLAGEIRGVFTAITDHLDIKGNFNG